VLLPLLLLCLLGVAPQIFANGSTIHITRNSGSQASGPWQLMDASAYADRAPAPGGHRQGNVQLRAAAVTPRIGKGEPSPFVQIPAVIQSERRKALWVFAKLDADSAI